MSTAPAAATGTAPHREAAKAAPAPLLPSARSLTKGWRCCAAFWAWCSC